MFIDYLVAYKYKLWEISNVFLFLSEILSLVL